jgi:hypothetical protein
MCGMCKRHQVTMYSEEERGHNVREQYKPIKIKKVRKIPF